MIKFKTNLKTSVSLIDLTPLVDVIFLMLIFFIVTSDILPFKSLNIDHPKLNHDSIPLTTQLLLVVDQQGILYLGSKKEIVDFDQLAEELKKKTDEYAQLNNGNTPTLVVSMDTRVEYGTFLKLFHAIQQSTSKIRLVYHYEREPNTL